MRASFERPGLVLLACVAWLAACGDSCACDACGGATAGLRVDGEHPFVRCLEMDPPAARAWTVGALHLAIEGRTLTVGAAPDAPDVAVVGGPAPGPADLDAALAPVHADPPTIVVVLGDLGDAREEIDAALVAFAGLGVPVLALPGGRDDASRWSDAFGALDDDARERVIDVAGIERVVVGASELLPVAGAPEGRYARTDEACGYRAADLVARAETLGHRPSHVTRAVLAWASPAGGIAPGLEGADAGDPALARFVESVGATSGVFAWPREAAGRPLDTDDARFFIVRRIAGPAAVRADGTRALPAVTRFRLRNGTFEPVADPTEEMN